MSAPMAPGDLSRTSAIRSEATATVAPLALRPAMEVGQVADFTVVVRVLEQGAEEFLVFLGVDRSR
jgi:hypothetical protein